MKTNLTIKLLLGGALAVSMLSAGSVPSASAAPVAKAPFKAKISVRQAQKVALKKYPGHLVGKTPLENEEGHMQYAVSVRSGKVLREVMVDATTGKIADVEVTTDAQEAKEAKADAKAKTAPTKPEASEKGEADEKGEAGEKG